MVATSLRLLSGFAVAVELGHPKVRKAGSCGRRLFRRSGRTSIAPPFNPSRQKSLGSTWHRPSLGCETLEGANLSAFAFDLSSALRPLRARKDIPSAPFNMEQCGDRGERKMRSRSREPQPPKHGEIKVGGHTPMKIGHMRKHLAAITASANEVKD